MTLEDINNKTNTLRRICDEIKLVEQYLESGVRGAFDQEGKVIAGEIHFGTGYRYTRDNKKIGSVILDAIHIDYSVIESHLQDLINQRDTMRAELEEVEEILAKL